MRHTLFSILVSLVVVVFGAPGVALAAPQDFTVNVVADHDDGSCDPWSPEFDCTLREAINASNASSDPGTISFDIDGAPFGSVQTISPTTALPPITAPVTIDGYTEPGASPNTLKLTDGDDAVLLIRVDGIDAGTGAVGLSLQGGLSVVRGLVITRFGDGVVLAFADNVVEGNFIGTDPTATTSLGNLSAGIRLSSSFPLTNRIGGPDDASRNIISGNQTGITSSGSSTAIVQGNYVGTNASGDGAIANNHGIFLQSGLIGGPGAGNLISGNIFNAVGAVGPVAVQGNIVGTDAGMTSSLPNGAGVAASSSGAGSPTIGGASRGMGNVLSGNDFYGVLVAGTDITVEGNWVGTDPTGTQELGNADMGVLLRTAGPPPVDALIRHNVIAFNEGPGIQVDNGTGNTFVSNDIYANTGLGIDLTPSFVTGVTPNDTGDGDTGPNGLQNFPELTVAAESLGGTNVQGTLNSTASTQFDVEAFSSSSCDPSGNGEGTTSLGTFHVTTDSSGNASFDHQFGASTPLGDVVTATATGPEGTSEFSGCETVAKAKTDLTLTKEDSPNIVKAGENVTYTLTVSNNGPNASSGVGLSDPLPSTADLVSASPSQGSCTGGGTVVCTLGTIAKDESATVTIVARLSTAGSVTNTATVDGTETDTNQANNTASAITIVTPNDDGCNVVGTSGDDYLAGTPGADQICGLGGNDTLIGKKGSDVLIGGDGNDVLKGGAGGDSLYGDAGDDTAVGGQGFDAAYGDIGADVLKIKDGAGGNDSADGGADLDVCKADAGDFLINCP
jgi:uncharacterized repeat protein (TIGR01451 family)/CSLREA domain-containing protein